MTSELVALLDGKEVGRVHNDARGRLTFVYDDDMAQRRGRVSAVALDAARRPRSMAAAVIEAFLWGLLPDNEHVLVVGQQNSRCLPATSLP